MKEFYSKIKSNFEEIDSRFENYLEYFENTWLNGGVFDMKDWNYSSSVSELESGEIAISQKLNFTNNSVEGMNCLIISLLSIGKNYLSFL